MAFDRVVIVGGSIAGLLTAAALSESFSSVVIVERDELPEESRHRRGVPQGLQVHALLAAGQNAMEELLPGIVDDFVENGARVVDSPADLAVYGSHGWSGRVKSEARVVCMRRPGLEFVVRRRVLALPNVQVVKGAVAGLIASDDGQRVTGVTLRGSTTLSLNGELIVDASGRSSKSPAWIEVLGYDRPREVELRSFVGYATVPVRLPDDALPPDVAGVLAHPQPGNPRGGAVVPCDNGLHQVAGLGMVNSDPPGEVDDFFAHIDQASSPLVGEVARKAELLGPVETYRMPGTRRRLWEELSQRPEGFVAIGDAVMSVNPIYGQGMSVASVEALTMRGVVEEADGRVAGLAERLQQAFVPTIESVFGMLVNVDGLYEDAELVGIERPDPEAVQASSYLSQVATEDAEVSLALKYAAHYFTTDALQTQSVQDKVRRWIESGRTVSVADPRTIPDVLNA